MTPFYNFGIHAYALGARIASCRSPKIKKMIAGQRDAFSRLEEIAPDIHGCVWVHAASLGEFEQGRPLIEKIRSEHPEKKILLTFFSPSGYEVRKNYKQADAVVYLPFDTPKNARRFLDLVNPSLAVFVKYEFWGNYLTELSRRGIPTYIISAIFRKKQIFFRPWGGEFRKILRAFTHLFVQDENSKNLLAGIGFNNVTIAGDTRFDRVTQILNAPAPAVKDLDKFHDSAEMTLVVGSSWEADEELYTDWLIANPGVKAIIAPHEFDDRRIARLCDIFNNASQQGSKGIAPAAVSLSQWNDNPSPETTRVIVVDCFGALATIYRFADVAYVGGGFGAGIHNINEAAVYGIPVVFGPKHSKFKEASDLIGCGGAFEVTDKASVAATLSSLLADSEKRKTAGAAAGEYIRQNLGATNRIYPNLPL